MEAKQMSTITKSASRKNLAKIQENYNVVATGKGTPWYETKTQDAVPALALVSANEDGKVWLTVEVDDDTVWYVNPVNDKNYQMINSIDEKYIGTEIQVVIAPQVLRDVTEKQLEAVEKKYGKDASASYRRLKADNQCRMALVELPIFE